MPKLSIVSHYYNHAEMVQSQIDFWETLPEDVLAQLEFILVDDCSEQPPVYRPTRLDLKVFKVVTPIDWNQPGARNLGAFNASGEWMLYFDIDQRFYLPPLAGLLPVLGQLDQTTMYHLRARNIFDENAVQLPFHPNTMLVHLLTFKAFGMYDEDFVGHYGYDDLYLPKVWEKRGGKRMLVNDHDYFEDLGFGTTNLNRDVSRNKALAAQKMQAGPKNSPGILRFEWERVAVERV